MRKQNESRTKAEPGFTQVKFMKRKLPAFDVLVDMARNHPERLESLRTELSQNIIDNAANETQRKRLAGLQFQIDMERERSRTPLQATIRISEMMCQSLAELHKSMVTPFVDDSSDKITVAEPVTAAEAAGMMPTAQVLSFTARRDKEVQDSDLD